jgi:pimeloyl-ACP methyl ester carboxylesterase
VLLHAFPLSAEMWRPQLDDVPRGWRLIAPDLLGFGQSDPVPASGSVEQAAGDVVALLDALGIQRAVVGGLSMGGYMTFAVLRRAPERLAGLVLADTKAGADTPAGREGRLKMLDRLREGGPAVIAADMVPKLVSTHSTAADAELPVRLRRAIEAAPAGAIEAAIHMLKDRPDSTADLARITVPTLIVVGSEDTLTPPSESAAMHRAVPQSQLVTIPHAGHLSNLEAPAAFNRALASFLATL